MVITGINVHQASALYNSLFILALVLFCNGLPVEATIDWVRPAALTESFLSRNTKPIVMVIRKSWCIPCMALRDNLEDAEKSASFAKLSREFVMVDAADADEPLDASFAPDGSYIPRVIFMDSAGKVRADVKSSVDMKPLHQYYYSSADQMAHSMERVVKDPSFVQATESSRTS